jgi:HK97 family phage major capsid protein
MAVKLQAEQIRTRQAAIQADLDSIEEKLRKPDELADDEVDDLQVRSEALVTEYDELASDLEPLAKREAEVARVRAQFRQQQEERESLDHLDGGDGGNEAGFGAPDVVIRSRIKDPFDALPQIRQGLIRAPELRARAMFAVEKFVKRDDQWGLDEERAGNVQRLVERSGIKFGAAVAEHILRTGSPEYLAAWQAYLEDPQGTAQRTAMSLTNVNGGYLVPFTLDPTIILTNAGSANPYRRISNVKTTATNDWNGVTSAGVTAEWTSEGTEAADATPTFGPLKITPQKADAYLFGSDEVLMDSDFATQLPELLQDAKDRLEEAAFAAGTGTGQPKGVTVAGTTLGGTTGSVASGPLTADIYALMAALPARWRAPGARNVWLANLNTINQMRNRPAFTGATTSIVNDSGDTPTMLGKQLLESTSIPSSSPTGSKCLVWLDGRQYYIVDRIGMSVVFDPMVIGTNRRPTGQNAWYALWRVGADVSTATAVRVLTSLT